MPHPYAHAYVCGRKDTPHPRYQAKPHHHGDEQVEKRSSPQRFPSSVRVGVRFGGGVWPIPLGNFHFP